MRSFCALLLSMLAGAPISSASVVVTNTTDAVNGDSSSVHALTINAGADGVSLREAIEAVNATPGRHRISFDPSLAKQKILLTAPLVLRRDDVEIRGFRDDSGVPLLTLESDGPWVRGASQSMLYVYGSRVQIAELRFARMIASAIEIEAGATSAPRPAPNVVTDVQIVDNEFDSEGVAAQVPAGIRIWTIIEGNTTNARIERVRVARNRFRRIPDIGVIVSASGVNTSIADIAIVANEFEGTRFPIEVAVTRGNGSAIQRTEIVGNGFSDGGSAGATFVPILIAVTGDPIRPNLHNAIEEMRIEGNRFDVDGGSSVSLVAELPSDAPSDGNVIRDVAVVNNIIFASAGIHIEARGRGARQNLVEDVRIINNTIAVNPQPALRIVENRDSGTARTVSDITALNTIFTRRIADRPHLDGEIAGTVHALRVAHSLTSDSRFVGFDGNISGDPFFADRNRGDLRLLAGSPAIDAGRSDGAPPFDAACQPRVGRPDIGALEYGSSAVARLTLMPVGNGFGRITATPHGVECQEALAYPVGTQIRLLATPESGSFFIAWEGDADCHDGEVIMLSNRVCSGRFSTIARRRTVRK